MKNCTKDLELPEIFIRAHKSLTESMACALYITDNF